MQFNYNSDTDIAGFQFNVDGVQVTGASGGAAQEAGFTVSNSSGVVLGFSLTGSTIPAGEGVLVNLDVDGDVSQACLSDLVFSDSSGVALEATVVDCTTIIIDEIESCDDTAACNYGDDGSCEYAEDNFDCNGDCTVDTDCAGDCGGDAVVDECGVCEGSGTSECWDGSAVCDLADCPDQPTDQFFVYYNTDVDIAGFQFDIDGADVLSAGGGDATAAGFTISNSATTVIGFSLTGGTIAAGEGTLIELEVSNAGGCLADLVFSDASGTALPATVVDCDTVVIDAIDDNVYGCTDIDACNYDDSATADNGSCDFGSYCWDGSVECDLADCPDQPGGTVNVLYDTDTAIAGFQFNVDGVEVTGASGGAAQEAGFTVSNSPGVVIGFSLTGGTIPAGSGVLTSLTVVGDTDNACLAELVFSDASGSSLGAEVVDCTTIIIDEIESCDDTAACNYGDDGSCEYAEDNFDCNGDCTVDTDCNGDCGGDAVVDECGVCEGSGTSECWDGSAVCDLADCPDQPTDQFFVYYNTDVDIAGFQFDIDGADVISAGGGDATAAGFTISNSATTVIGFSLTGGTIAAGEGTLIELEVSNAGGCLADLVFSDASGTALPATVVDCDTVVIDAIDDNVYGCTDIDACNYDGDATADDGSCDFGSYCWDGFS